MQKVIRRTLFAEKQAARRLEKRKEKLEKIWATRTRQTAIWARRAETSRIKAAKQARTEDWELGPLAPRRDVGSLSETYGTVDHQQTRPPELHYRDRDEILKSVGGQHLNIVKGDRVVILEGRDKGKIGKVLSTDKRTGTCTVEGLNLVDIAIPKWMMNASDETDKRAIRTMEGPVPLPSVRLVFPLTDTETGQTRDVIIKKLVNTAFYRDKETRTTHWKRIIPGLNLIVPWPKQEPTVQKDHDCDTLRLDVEVRTFVPTLLRPPMPSSVIDELRNKYSKFRTRHDPEYIEAKMKEDLEAEAKARQIKEMRTPLKEINKRERKLKKAKGRGKLTEEMLESIGKVIARNRRLILDSPAPTPSATVAP